SQPRRGQQKSEKRQAGNHLNDADGCQYRLAQVTSPGEQNAQRKADERSQQNRDAHQPHVLQAERPNLAAVQEEEIEHQIFAFLRMRSVARRSLSSWFGTTKVVP